MCVFLVINNNDDDDDDDDDNNSQYLPGSHCMPGIVLRGLDVLIINFPQQHDVLGSIWSRFIDADLYYILHPGICTALRIWQKTNQHMSVVGFIPPGQLIEVITREFSLPVPVKYSWALRTMCSSPEIFCFYQMSWEDRMSLT